MSVSRLLYSRLLGDQFDSLPEALRRFHAAPEGSRATGVLRVVRAQGRLRSALASLLGLPASGDAVPTELRVSVEGNRERWTRRFQGRPIETVQWDWHNLLLERSGPFSFSCALRLEGSRLHYEFRRAWFYAFPLPQWLAPCVVSHVDGRDKGWDLYVQINAPFLGEIVRYEGAMAPV